LFVRVFNNIPRAVLRSPLHGLMDGRFILLGFSGRKSGRAYRVPVAYVEHEGALLVGAGAPWVKNLADGRPITVWYRGRKREATPEFVRDRAEFARLANVILKVNPVWGRFNQLALGPDGTVDPNLLDQALSRGTTLIRLRLEGH
jgi:deazaflavin-dependent oxidoreductase (nitroreductase family)